MIYLFLAQGFEEMEAIAPLDVLRKSGLEVKTVGVGNQIVSGNVHVPIKADMLTTDLDFSTIDALIIPGGYGGAKRLLKSDIVLDAVRYCHEKGGIIGAICAGPSVLEKAGILDGKTITCYPGIEEWFLEKNIKVTGDDVTCDGNIVTAKGPGVALDFAFTLLEVISKDFEKSENLKKSMCCAMCVGCVSKTKS